MVFIWLFTQRAVGAGVAERPSEGAVGRCPAALKRLDSGQEGARPQTPSSAGRSIIELNTVASSATSASPLPVWA